MTEFTEEQLLTEALARSRAREGLSAFTEYCDLGFVPAAHHRVLLEHLEAIERGDIDRLIVNLPPGAAKSTYGSVIFPAWWLGRHPDSSVLAVSNSLELAERFSRRARNLVGLPQFEKVFGFGVSEETRAAGSWATAKGGEYYAAGVGTAIAGRRADLFLIDDPIRNREAAASETIRESTWDWYLNDAVTRIKPHGRRVIISTRWHEDDLCGRLLEKEGNLWTHLCIPMEAEANDPLGRKPGERLWSDWYTAEMVLEAKSNPIVWSALYQQRPAPLDGEYFRREWFPLWQRQPSGLHVYGASDFATTDDGGDFTELGIFGLDVNGAIYVLDWWRGQKSSDVWIDAMIDLIARWSPLKWFGEAGQIRRAVEPFLIRRMKDRQVSCQLEWLPSMSDKVLRARAIQGKASMGDVHLPQSAPWVADILPQLLQFPNGKYDDAVDVFSLIGRGLDKTQLPKVKKPSQPAPVVRYGANSWMAG